jgi:hypothetical protein
MRERCDFHRSTIAIGNAFIDYTVFIPRIRARIAIAAHAHRSRNWKLSFSAVLGCESGCRPINGHDVVAREFAPVVCQIGVALQTAMGRRYLTQHLLDGSQKL